MTVYGKFYGLKTKLIAFFGKSYGNIRTRAAKRVRARSDDFSLLLLLLTSLVSTRLPQFTISDYDIHSQPVVCDLPLEQSPTPLDCHYQIDNPNTPCLCKPDI